MKLYINPKENVRAQIEKATHDLIGQEWIDKKRKMYGESPDFLFGSKRTVKTADDVLAMLVNFPNPKPYQNTFVTKNSKCHSDKHVHFFLLSEIIDLASARYRLQFDFGVDLDGHLREAYQTISTLMGAYFLSSAYNNSESIIDVCEKNIRVELHKFRYLSLELNAYGDYAEGAPWWLYWAGSQALAAINRLRNC